MNIGRAITGHYVNENELHYTITFICQQDDNSAKTIVQFPLATPDLEELRKLLQDCAESFSSSPDIPVIDSNAEEIERVPNPLYKEN